jgi:DNA-directed RNA polymerase subunit RPC12/RpoP
MSASRGATKDDRRRSAAYLVGFVLLITVTGALLIPRFWPGGLVVWLAIVTGSMFVLVRWHARSTVYRCAACGHEFEIPPWTDLFAPHVPDKKRLKCPECGTRDWAEILVKEPQEEAAEVDAGGEDGALN